jgi:hypothetical protein
VDAQDPPVPEGLSDAGAPGADVADLPPPPASSPPPVEPPASAPLTPPEQGYYPPPAYPPGPGYPRAYAAPGPVAPQAEKANTGRLIAIVVAVAVLVLGGAGVAANAVLSSTYSPERAVTDYFAAQGRGDVSSSMANATFQLGSDPAFFNRDGVTAMLAVAQNKDIRNVKVVSSTSVDSSTQSVGVSLTWAGQSHSQNYMVRRDNSQTHYLFYHPWRIVIPLVTIHVKLPNQPGRIQVDGITPTGTDGTIAQAVQGYHQVTMGGNFLYDSTSQVVNGVDGDPTANFAPPVSATALTNAADAVNRAFPICDYTKYTGCPNHTYTAPNDGYLYYFNIPGDGRVYYTTYVITDIGDPSAGMKVTVPADANKLNAAGVCKETLTIDGSKHFNLAGSWTGVLTWTGAQFGAQLTSDCGSTAA